MMFEMPEILHAVRCLFLPGCQLAACNSYALHQNFESDFLTVSKAGFVHEVEIKLSRADFLRDFNKSGYSKKLSQDGLIEIVKKHDLIKAGHLANYFWFAAPEGLLSLEDVPEYAGLIILKRNTDTRRNLVPFAYARKVREAKRLHKNKISDAQKNRMLTSMMYQAWDGVRGGWSLAAQRQAGERREA